MNKNSKLITAKAGSRQSYRSNDGGKTKNLKQETGFTLVEILVVILIFGLIGTVVSATFFTSLKGASRTETVKDVKQNGDYALSVMEQNLRNAETIRTACTGNQSTQIQFTPQGSSVITTYNCTGAPFRISEQIGTDPATFLTNTSVTLGSCSITNLSFTCTSGSDGKPQDIIIQFTLSDVAGSGIGSTSQTFRTQVSLRN
jgi:prepilin-type N-terminal cleavage/methylation domain-containing protein